MDKFKSLFAVGLVVMFFTMGALSTGCNTIRGAGEDIEAGGEKVQDVAE